MRKQNPYQLYHRLLLPDQIRTRVASHLIFWMAFMVYHMIFFMPILPERVMSEDTRLAYLLYYARFIPTYYLALLVMLLTGQPSQRWYSPVVVVLVCISVMHLLTKPLYHFYERAFGLENLPKNFQLVGSYYLRPWIPQQKLDLGAFIYDLMDLQLLALPVGLKWLRQGAMSNLKRSELEKQKLEIELKEVRGLLTPHFILNVISAANTEVETFSTKASDYLMHAADMIRFALYDAHHEFIQLERELEFISRYLSLEAMRTSRRSTIVWDVNGEPKPVHRVPTLLITTLIENAIKHGVHSTPEHSYVKIDCLVEETKLTIQVFNTKPVFGESTNEKSGHGGLGLASLRLRLDGYFPDQHLLRVTDRPSSFLVYLQIPLIS